VANGFAASFVADAFGLMQRMRNVIGKSALLQDPGAVGGKGESGDGKYQA
jgi:hypothetical protein